MSPPTVVRPPLVENGLTRRYLDRVRTATTGRRSTEHRLAALPVAPPDRFLSRPVLLDGEDHRSVADAVAGAFDLLAGLPDRLFDGDLGRYATAVGMTSAQADLVLRNAGTRPVRFGRADLYREADGFRLLEFNICSALGGMEIAEVNRAMLADPAVAGFVAEEGLTAVDPLARMVATMRAEFADLPTGRRVVVALTDWPASFVTLEPYLTHLARLLGRHGVDAVACHLGQLEYTAGGVSVHGRRVDVVHRFFMPPDYLDGPDAPAHVRRLLSAVEAGAVRLFTPLDSELYGNKAALALLHEHRDDPRFTAAERRLVAGLLPATRFVRDDGTIADVLRHRDRYVLKPSLLYGGRSIVAGWTVGPREWDRQVRAAVGTGAVLQRRVRPVLERYPVPGGDTAETMFVNYGAFLMAGGFAGATARGGADTDVGVLSIAAGARPGCVFSAPPEQTPPTGTATATPTTPGHPRRPR